MLWARSEAPRYHFEPEGADIADLAAELPPEGVIISDMGQFVDTLGRIGQTLGKADLPAGFNYVYHYLSEEVLLAMTRDKPSDDALSVLREKHKFDRATYPKFQFPDEVERTAGIFGEYYFSQLRLYTQAVQTKNPAILDQMTSPWQQALLDPRMKNALPGLQFLAGMFTHISARDLAASLVESNVSQEYYDDYTQVVNKLIEKTTDDLAPELMRGHSALRLMLKKPTVGIIAVMREVAWQDSKKLASASPSQHDRKLRVLDATAERYNNKVLKLGGIAMRAAAVTERLPEVPVAATETTAKVISFGKRFFTRGRRQPNAKVA